jgi:L,D-transpeptidase ErfK/SrfK
VAIGVQAIAACVAVLVVALAARSEAAEFSLEKDQAAVGEVGSYHAAASDNLLDIARRFDVGYVELMAANPGVDPWSPGAGTRIVIPTMFILPDGPRVGIVINLAERRLFYFPPGGKSVETYPVGIGVEDGATPIGTTRVVRKEEGPVWVPPPSIRAERPDLPLSIPPGPDDPLGAYALRTGWNNILIHGTNKPDSVGRNVSHGCFHVYPEDIERLFGEVAVGTPVRTISQAVASAWIDGRLTVEVYPSKEQADEIDYGKPMTPALPQDLVAQVTAVADNNGGDVDWDELDRAGKAATGLPTPVTSVNVATATVDDDR